ncbi:ABC-type multidrug transport system, ATPase component (plasmid) [Methanomethylovorans hollandica DSM 15978]|uniref:ABC-type multidrug transport system, ATPase component n=1 Tax=Methanomethylovorans hollandica (strain DSM 15978 / NBRC 107637 / DMS1) TaxID=867904 RepID=L0L156_METHD|nr:ABC transporter ATP-binding protein [Methanomethylovorans hollandica]AGB50680.1 ABC-type multidrug transport system, ATPase component [Methanomethylovorans hollandica DSM 15978]
MDNVVANENVIELKGLTKKFGKHNESTAVNALNLEVRKGEVFGFVGPNGAGKTTTMKMMIGLLEPTSGSGKVAGFDIVREVINIREATGVLPEPAGFYDHLTARQNLRFYAKLYDIEPEVREKRIVDLLNLVGLEKAIDQKIGGFSTGMRKRFGLAQALINEPSILFLDEPTSGIDPLGAQMMRDLIKDLNQNKGVTVFLSSHSMEEVEEICDRIAIVARGKLLAVGSVEELRAIVKEKEGVNYLLEVQDIPLSATIDAIRSIDGVQITNTQDSTLHIHTNNMPRGEIAKSVKNAGGTISMFEEEEMNLQKLFLKIIEGVQV